MKNIVLVFVIVAALLQAAIAQVNFGFKAGLNLSKISGDWEEAFGDLEGMEIDLSPKFKTGLFIGAFVELGVSEKFAIQPEVLFSMKGVRFNDDFKQSEVTPEYSYHAEGEFTIIQELNYIEIPLLAKYKSGNGLNLLAGPYLGILTSAKAKSEAEFSYTASSFGQIYSGEEFFSETQSTTEFFKTLDFGLAAGINYEFPFGLGIEAMFLKGLTDLPEENPDDPFTNTTIRFGLSYRVLNN